MKIIQTTIRCSKEEHELINKTSKIKGFPTVSNFINYCLDKNLPLTESPVLNFTINRSAYRLGASVPFELHKKLMQNVKELTSPMKTVKMYHVVLTCILKECEF